MLSWVALSAGLWAPQRRRVVLPFSEALDLKAVGQAGFSECVLLGCPADRQLDAADDLSPCRLTLAPLDEGVRDSESYPYF